MDQNSKTNSSLNTKNITAIVTIAVLSVAVLVLGGFVIFRKSDSSKPEVKNDSHTTGTTGSGSVVASSQGKRTSASSSKRKLKETKSSKSSEEDESSEEEPPKEQTQGQDPSKARKGATPNSKKPKKVDGSNSKNTPSSPLKDPQAPSTPLPKTQAESTPGKNPSKPQISAPLTSAPLGNPGSDPSKPAQPNSTPSDNSESTSSDSVASAISCILADQEFESALNKLFTDLGDKASVEGSFTKAKEACKAEAATSITHDYSKPVDEIVRARYNKMWTNACDPKTTPDVSNISIQVRSALSAVRLFDSGFLGGKAAEDLLCAHFVSLYEADLKAPDAKDNWKKAKYFCPMNHNKALSMSSFEDVKKPAGNEVKTVLDTSKPAGSEVEVALDACIAKFDAQQDPSAAELKALDDALSKDKSLTPGMNTREQVLFDHYSKRLEHDIFIDGSWDPACVEPLISSILRSSPSIIQANGVKLEDLEDVKFAKLICERLNRGQIDLQEMNVLLAYLESGKLKVLAMKKEIIVIIKCMVKKTDHALLNRFFRYYYSETKATNDQKFFEPFGKYASELASYMEKSFASQAEADEAHRRVEALREEAATKDLYNLPDTFRVQYSRTPEAKPNSVPLKCGVKDQQFIAAFENRLKGGKSATYSFITASKECIEYATFKRMDFDGKLVSYADFYKRDYDDFEVLVLKEIAKGIKSLSADQRTDDKYSSQYGPAHGLKAIINTFAAM